MNIDTLYMTTEYRKISIDILKKHDNGAWLIRPSSYEKCNAMWCVFDTDELQEYCENKFNLYIQPCNLITSLFKKCSAFAISYVDGNEIKHKLQIETEYGYFCISTKYDMFVITSYHENLKSLLSHRKLKQKKCLDYYIELQKL